MNFYSKKGLLFLVQIDHLSGEIIGDVIDSFYEVGAKNVQVLSAITKKNRPGYLMLIDGTESTASAIEEIIVEECGSSGWHRIDTCHRHTDLKYLAKAVQISVGEASFSFTLRGKQIADDSQMIRPEYDSCAALQAELKKYGKSVSFRRLQAMLASVFREDGCTQIYF